MTQPPSIPPSAPVQPYAPGPSPDESHLNILSICYWVLAGLQGLACVCCGGYSIIVGGLVGGAAAQAGGSGAFGIVPLLITACWGLLILAFAAGNFFAGKFLKTRQNYTFCFVWAIVTCLGFPLGTVLGVFTIIVLNRPSVKAMFGRA